MKQLGWATEDDGPEWPTGQDRSFRHHEHRDSIWRLQNGGGKGIKDRERKLKA